MKDTHTRVFALMCVLVVVWTAVYWLYEPPEPPVTFDRSTGDATDPDARVQDPMAEVTPPFPDRKPDPAPVVEAKAGERRAAATPPAPTPTPPPQDTPRTRVIPPEYWEYTVQSGDNMELIARRLFGDGRLWPKIAEANPFLDARKLVPGRTRLKIPKDLGNIQGKEVAVPQSGGPAPAAEPAKTPPTAPPAPSAAQEYVVRTGDTLSSIAKSFYGKSAMWRTIFEANKGVIDDPDNVKPGTTIKIPPRE